MSITWFPEKADQGINQGNCPKREQGEVIGKGEHGSWNRVQNKSRPETWGRKRGKTGTGWSRHCTCDGSLGGRPPVPSCPPRPLLFAFTRIIKASRSGIGNLSEKVNIAEFCLDKAPSKVCHSQEQQRLSPIAEGKTNLQVLSASRL